MPQISSYFASLGFEVDKASVRKVDNALKGLEKRLKRFGKDIQGSLSINVSAFKIDQKRLNLALGTALDLASTQTVFNVSRFHIDQSRLNGAMINAMANAAQTASRVVALRPVVRPVVSPVNRPAVSTTGERIRPRHVVAGGAAGGVAASLSRLYGPAIGLGLGGYGLANLNQRNQQIVAAQLQTSAVAQQAGATPQQGQQSFEWLRQQGNRIGFNYLDAAADYNKLTSGLTGAGFSIKQSQDVFKGFSELSRVQKLDRVTQQRVYRALSQIAGKGKLQGDELTNQLAEALPGSVDLFALAYQRQLKAEGKGKGDLQGQEAITALLAAMKKGQVNSGVLNYAGAIASERAQPGLTAASTASQAEQARFQNSFNDLSRVASDNGVESGFSRLFRSLNEGLKESNPQVISLAKGFDEVSKYVSFALLSVQSLQRFFDGKDSYLGDKFFPDEESRNLAFGFLNSYKTLMSEIVDLGKASLRGWKELSDLMGTGPLAKFKEQIDTIANGINAANKIANGDYSGAVDSLKGFGKKYANIITTPGRAGINVISDAVTYGAAAIDPRTTMDQVTPWQLDAPFANTNSLFDYQRMAKEKQDEAFANRRRDNFNGPLGIFPTDRPTMPDANISSPLTVPKADVKLDVTVKIDAANPEDFGNQFKQHLSDIVHQTLDKYSEK